MERRVFLLQTLLACTLVSGCGGGGEAGSNSMIEQNVAVVRPDHVVRFIYFYSADGSIRPVYSSAIESAALSIQGWYAAQLEGHSIRLASPVVEACRGQQPASYYATQSWSRVAAAIKNCFPEFAWDDPAHRWVIYADVRHQCGDQEYLGATARGVTILPVQDLQGVSGEHSITDDCGAVIPYVGTAGINRWIGGLGHELGHALGLPHPPGCEQGEPACDSKALMWLGYVDHPNSSLRYEERAVLRLSPFVVPVSPRQ